MVSTKDEDALCGCLDGGSPSAEEVVVPLIDPLSSYV